jgi:hypothetical protein
MRSISRDLRLGRGHRKISFPLFLLFIEGFPFWSCKGLQILDLLWLSPLL